jgi:hypothetical protein
MATRPYVSNATALGLAPGECRGKKIVGTETLEISKNLCFRNGLVTQQVPILQG